MDSKMDVKKHIQMATWFIAGLTLVYTCAYSDCYTIAAGCAATQDGSVMFAHNEDDSRQFVVRLNVLERKAYNHDEYLILDNGARISQPDTTWRCLLFEMPGMRFSDSLINEHGVVIASDGCPSREDREDLTDGGIGRQLRRIVAQRARTAREGMEFIGDLVERFGYVDSGRTYTVCDSGEAWIVAVVKGRHWVAHRVPDDQVAVVANTYSIHHVDLSDTAVFRGSDDLIEYATDRGWYNSARDGKFDFAKVYASPQARTGEFNTYRQWRGLTLLTSMTVPPPEEIDFPFSVKPGEPVTAPTLFSILRDHYEGTELYHGNNRHFRSSVIPICRPETNISQVFQLRGGMPPGIGSLVWTAMWQPCSTPYIPLYLGIDDPPEILTFMYELQGGQQQGMSALAADKMYRVMGELALLTTMDESRYHETRVQWETWEHNAIQQVRACDKAALTLWGEDKNAASGLLTSFTHGMVYTVNGKARKLNDRFTGVLNDN